MARKRKGVVSLCRRPDRRGWQIRWYTDNGIRHRRSFPLKSEAAAEGRRIEELLERGIQPEAIRKSRGRGRGRGFAWLIAEWLADVASRGRQATVRDYRNRIDRFFRWSGRDPFRVIIDDVRSYCEFRLKRVAKSTVNGDIRTLSAFYSWAIRWGYATTNPVRGVQMYRVQKGRKPDYLKKREVEKLFREVHHPVFRAVFALGAFAGLRATEISRISWEDVDFEREVIHVRGETKTYEDRTVPLSDTCKAILGPLRGSGRVIGDHTPSWLSHRGNALLRGALGRKAAIARLRHTFASLHIQAGTSLTKVAYWLGDRHDTVQDHYAYLQPRDPEINRLRLSSDPEEYRRTKDSDINRI